MQYVCGLWLGRRDSTYLRQARSFIFANQFAREDVLVKCHQAFLTPNGIREFKTLKHKKMSPKGLNFSWLGVKNDYRTLIGVDKLESDVNKSLSKNVRIGIQDSKWGYLK